MDSVQALTRVEIITDICIFGLVDKYCLGLDDQITLVRVPGSSALEVKMTT